MIDQKLIWDATYKWLGDHKLIVYIYNQYTGKYKVVMEHDMGSYTISVSTCISDNRWYEIELDAFKFRALLMHLYDMIRKEIN